MKYTLLLMFLTNLIFGQNTDMKSELIKRFNNANEYTIKTLDKMPEELLAFKPNKKVRSFAEIFQHIGEAQLYTASQGVEVKQIKFQGNLSNKTALKAFLKQSNELLLDAMKKLSKEDLQKEVRFWDGQSSIFKILNFTIDHVTHHRGQATIYLRLNDLKPPDYIGW